MKNRAFFPALIAAVLAVTPGACKNPGRPGPENPVTVTIWHTMTSDLKDRFDELVDEFNTTRGQKEGITVVTGAIMETQPLAELLIASARDDPGAPELPDIATLYPAVAAHLAGLGKLVDLRTLFSEDELASYVPAFLEEGRLDVSDGPLYVLPFAKSTEVMYINATLFNRFAAEYAVLYGGPRPAFQDLETFEGIAALAEKYYRWSDGKTPDIPGDGKSFFYPDAVYNFFALGFEQHGEHLIVNQKLNTASPVFKKLWDYWFSNTVRGTFPIFNLYGNYIAQTGDIVCCTSSSAGARFYPDAVTSRDNVREPVEFTALPYPVFAGKKKIALQRGAGAVICASNETREYAASVFLKWFTAPENNIRFTSLTSYLPVETAAYDSAMFTDISFDNPVVESAFKVTMELRESYDFFVPPVFNGLDELQTRFKAEILKAAERARAGDGTASEEEFRVFTGKFE